MMSSLSFITTLSIVLHLCKLSIVSLLVASVFMWFFEMLKCYSPQFNQKIANCIIQLLNSGLKNARKIIRILYFLSNADVSNKFAKFQRFGKERWPTGCFFFTQLKLNMSETRKSKNWKSYINTVQNVSTASHKLPHVLSKHVSMVKN